MSARGGVALLLVVVGMLVLLTSIEHVAVGIGGPRSADPRELAQLATELGYRTARLGVDVAALEDIPPQGAGLILVGGGVRLDREQMQAVLAFVEGGGRLVVLGDAQVVEVLGATIAPTPIAPGPSGRVAAFATLGATTVDVQLVDGWPLLVPGPGFDTFALTSPDSFVDADGDGRRTTEDAGGPFTIGVRILHGQVHLLSTRAPAHALDEPSVRAFAAALLEQAFPPGTELLLDGSRATSAWERAATAPAAAVLDMAHRPLQRAVLLVAVALATAQIVVAQRQSVRLAGIESSAGQTADLESPVPLPVRAERDRR